MRKSIVALINYGSGNFNSVANALIRLDIPFREVKTPSGLKDATHIILPGVGSFRNTMDCLKSTNFDFGITYQVLDNKKPFLGICVGMQVLADFGTENDICPGLGLIPGVVKRIDTKNSGLPLPHIGWNEIEARFDDPLLNNIVNPATFYFVHSYSFKTDNPKHTIAQCHYGINISAIIRKENIWGVQFHPEKSQQDGLALLRNFFNQR